MTAQPTSSTTAAPAFRLGPRLLIVLAALMWSTHGLFVKSPLMGDWPSEWQGLLLAFWRSFFVALFLLPLVRKPRLTWRLLPLVIAFPSMSVMFFSSMALSTTANAIWLQYLAPVWVTLVGVTLLGEKMTRRDWVLLACGVTGVGVILAFELTAAARQGASPWGMLLGVGSGVAYAGVILSLRQLRDLSSLWIVTAGQVASAVVLLPAVVAIGVWPSGTQWLWLAGFAMLQFGLPYLLFARALREVPGHEAAGIVLLEPVLAPLWTWLAWHEQPAWWTLLGAGFILAGLLLRYAGQRKKSLPS